MFGDRVEKALGQFVIVEFKGLAISGLGLHVTCSAGFHYQVRVSNFFDESINL